MKDIIKKIAIWLIAAVVVFYLIVFITAWI